MFQERFQKRQEKRKVKKARAISFYIDQTRENANRINRITNAHSHSLTFMPASRCTTPTKMVSGLVEST